MSDDKGFEVVDKRMTDSTEAAEEAAAAEAEVEAETPQPAAEGEAEPEAAKEHVHGPECEHEHEHEQAGPSPGINTIVSWMIGMLATTAWQKMGLQVDPGTGKAEKDLEEAKIAIDCIMALSDKISPRLEESGRRELRGIIGDLQINFVNQSK